MTLRLFRTRWFWIACIPAIALAAYLAFGVFGIQALWTNTRVDDAFPLQPAPAQAALIQPTAQPTATTPPTMVATPQPTMPPSPEPSTAARIQPTIEPTAEPTAVPTIEPTEPTAVPPPAGPVLITAGQFHAVEHQGSGAALVYQQPDGSYVLRLENLDVENGPDLYVYVVAAPDANDGATVENAGFLNVGQLKGNQGNQTYQLPAEFDPTVHRSITIWCQRFAVNFVTAPLR